MLATHPAPPARWGRGAGEEPTSNGSGRQLVLLAGHPPQDQAAAGERHDSQKDESHLRHAEGDTCPPVAREAEYVAPLSSTSPALLPAQGPAGHHRVVAGLGAQQAEFRRDGRGSTRHYLENWSLHLDLGHSGADRTRGARPGRRVLTPRRQYSLPFAQTGVDLSVRRGPYSVPRHQPGRKLAHRSCSRAAPRDEASLGYQWLRRPRRLLALLDGFAAACALLALFAMSSWRPMASPADARVADLGTALVLLLTVILGFRNGQYTSSRRLSRFTDPGRLATHLLIATSVIALLAFATKGFFVGSLDFSRLLVFASLAIFFVLAASARVVLAVHQRSLFMNGAVFRKVLVLGSGRAGADFVDFLAKRPWLGVACVGRLGYCLPADETGRSSLRREGVGLHFAHLRGPRQPRPDMVRIRSE